MEYIGNRDVNAEIYAELMSRIGVLLLFLSPHLIRQVAFAIAVHHGLICVDAEILDDIGLVQLIATLYYRIHHAVQHKDSA